MKGKHIGMVFALAAQFFGQLIPLSAEELTYSNFREKLEYFSQSDSKQKDFENLLSMLADQWSPKSETAAPVVGFLLRYLAITPDAFSTFERMKDKFKSQVWVSIIAEAREGKVEKLNNLLSLNREYWVIPDIGWFSYYVDLSPAVLDYILESSQTQYTKTGYTGLATELKQLSKRHQDIAKAIEFRKGTLFDLVRNSSLEQLQKKTREDNLRNLGYKS